MPEDRVGELGRGGERLVAVAEVGAEELVHGREHLRSRAVVPRQREELRRLLAPLAEDLDVRVPEPVDGLELVPHVEHFLRGRAAGEGVDQLALEAVRVLELVHHDEPEAELLGLAHGRVVAKQVARHELEVLEVERRLARLRGRVLVGEAAEEILEQVAVAGGELFEGHLLDALPGLLVGGGALTARPQVAQVEQALGRAVEVERPAGVRPLQLRRRRVVGKALRSLPQLGQTLLEARPIPQLEDELAPGRAERLVDGGEHPPQTVRPVRREQPQTLRVAAGAEVLERALERLAPHDGALRLVELAEARVDPDRERMRAQQPCAEAVDRRDPGAVELPRQVAPAAADELLANPPPKLARRLARVCDHEHRVDVDPAVAHRTDEALDEHRRLPGPRAGGDEDLAFGLDRRHLLGVHARVTRHMGQTSHHAGHWPPLGSWRTSPARIRCA